MSDLVLHLDVESLLTQARRWEAKADDAERLSQQARLKAQRFRALAAKSETQPVTVTIRTDKR